MKTTTTTEQSSPELLTRRRCWIDVGGFALGEFEDDETAMLASAPLGAVIQLLSTNEPLWERDIFGGWTSLIEPDARAVA